MNLTFDPRAAGEIIRYHTWSVHRKQSVGEHTWQIMRILLTVWPDCPLNVLQHAVGHDIGEMAGDIPYPYKLKVPELRVGADKAEAMVKSEMDTAIGLPPDPDLDELETLIFKLVEYVEMWEYGRREVNLGNRYAQLITDRMADQIEAKLAALPDHELGKRIYANVRDYMRRRIEMEK